MSAFLSRRSIRPPARVAVAVQPETRLQVSQGADDNLLHLSVLVVRHLPRLMKTTRKAAHSFASIATLLGMLGTLPAAAQSLDEALAGIRATRLSHSPSGIADLQGVPENDTEAVHWHPMLMRPPEWETQ